MKVSEFIEWLKTQDQDATVKVVVHKDYYNEGNSPWAEPFTTNLAYGEQSPQYGKHYVRYEEDKILLLGNIE